MISRNFSLFKVACFALVVGGLTGCSGKEAPKAPPPPSVKLYTVVNTDAEYFDAYPATVSALNQVELRPQASGFVTGVLVADGARVRKGQLLYTFDNQSENAAYQQSVAALQVEKANLELARKDADRYHQLQKKDAVATQLVDQAEAKLDVARRQVAAAQAAISGSQTAVGYTKIYAPFDGVIGISQVKVGAAVTAGQTLLNTVSADGDMAADFNVGQNEIYRFSKMLQSDNATGQDSVFQLAFGEDVFPQPGRLVLIDRAVNPQTGTIRVRVRFPNPSRTLVAGMSGEVRVKSSGQNAIAIPQKAVTEQLGEYFVYVATDSNTVTQRKVTTGRAIDSLLLISEGLKPGDRIVTEGVQNLQEGAKITPVQN
jgi:membrane fusion protein (multidrug efflux system)